MTEFYIRRIGSDKRVRMRVTVNDSTVTVLLVSYLKGKFHRPGTWTLDQKFYQFTAKGLPVEYLLLIESFESCTKSEFRTAFANAIKAKALQYLIPAHEILSKIEKFMKSIGEI